VRWPGCRQGKPPAVEPDILAALERLARDGRMTVDHEAAAFDPTFDFTPGAMSRGGEQFLDPVPQ
jgi:hypothetical protein